MSKETVLKLAYIYKRLLSLYQNEDPDIFHESEQWFIRQVISHMINTKNPDFKRTDFDLNEIYNTDWD